MESIQSLKDKILYNENLSNEEKQILYDKSEFLSQFFVYLKNLESNYSESKKFDNNSLHSKGWWSEWKSCIMGTVGSAWGGGISGCTGVGILGFNIGRVVYGAQGGVIGAIAGCTAGGIIGGIAGGLVGHASFCN